MVPLTLAHFAKLTVAKPRDALIVALSLPTILTVALSPQADETVTVSLPAVLTVKFAPLPATFSAACVARLNVAVAPLRTFADIIAFGDRPAVNCAPIETVSPASSLPVTYILKGPELPAVDVTVRVSPCTGALCDDQSRGLDARLLPPPIHVVISSSLDCLTAIP